MNVIYGHLWSFLCPNVVAQKLFIYFRVFYQNLFRADWSMVEESPILLRPRLPGHKQRISYMGVIMRWTTALLFLNLSLTHRPRLWHQQHRLIRTVNLLAPISHSTHSLGTFSMPCHLDHSVMCRTTRIMGWVGQQILREVLLLARVQCQNRDSHHLVPVLHLHISYSITLIHQCIQDNSPVVLHRDTLLALDQLLFLILLWTMGILHHRPCRLLKET